MTFRLTTIYDKKKSQLELKPTEAMREWFERNDYTIEEVKIEHVVYRLGYDTEPTRSTETIVKVS